MALSANLFADSFGPTTHSSKESHYDSFRKQKPKFWISLLLSPLHNKKDVCFSLCLFSGEIKSFLRFLILRVWKKRKPSNCSLQNLHYRGSRATVCCCSALLTVVLFRPATRWHSWSLVSQPDFPSWCVQESARAWRVALGGGDFIQGHHGRPPLVQRWRTSSSGKVHWSQYGQSSTAHPMLLPNWNPRRPLRLRLTLALTGVDSESPLLCRLW